MSAYAYLRASTIERLGLPPTSDTEWWADARATGKVRSIPEENDLEVALTQELLAAVIRSPRLKALIDQSVTAHMTPKPRRRWWWRT
jgi:hypothetical protein